MQYRRLYVLFAVDVEGCLFQELIFCEVEFELNFTFSNTLIFHQSLAVLVPFFMEYLKSCNIC
jgi:hypothetical protein